MEERLQKFIARCGIASRRKCEKLILNNRIKVNNTLVNKLGYKINSEIDKIYLDNKLIKPEKNKIYIMLNKPTGYISTVKDERGRKTLLDLVKVKERIYPIGRLDYDSSGLIFLTNDGTIYNKIIHPRVKLNKTYLATIKGIPSKEEIKRFCTGIDIGGYVTAPAKINIIKKINNNSCEVKIIIHEGKNRQIRKMCNIINHPVLKLKRISIGNIILKNLSIGKWRYLSKKEITYLKNV